MLVQGPCCIVGTKQRKQSNGECFQMSCSSNNVTRVTALIESCATNCMSIFRYLVSTCVYTGCVQTELLFSNRTETTKLAGKNEFVAQTRMFVL